MFAGESVQQSVVKIRLFNSMVSVLVLAALLITTTSRIRFNAIAGLSF